MSKMFISWSGNPKIAEELKKSITDAFSTSNLSVFVSSENISTGEEWFAAIKRNLQDSIMTLVCVTRDNINAPWLYFEAGASQFHNYSNTDKSEEMRKKLLMVILFDMELPEGSPLKAYNYIRWGNDGFTKLFKDINNRLIAERESTLSGLQVVNLAKGSFVAINKTLKPILREIRERHSGQSIRIYPEGENVYEKKRLYLACPMASLDDEDQYKSIRDTVQRIKAELVANCKIPAQKIYAPALVIESQDRFDGSEKAIAENFAIMKRAEFYVCLYEKSVATSMIAEIGYCIALKKNIVIFQKAGVKLPYILQDSNNALPFVKIYKYKTADEIIDILKKNKDRVLRIG